MPLHIRAEAAQLAPVALLMGDPGRVRRATALLEDGACYNEHRGLLGFTGSYRSRPVSLQTTGMGGPSAAIVVEELATLGVRTMVRVGTCGSVSAELAVLDLAIATAAVPLDGTTRQYLGGDPFAPVADFAVTGALVAAAAGGARRCRTGLFISEDAFYHQADDWETWRARGVMAVEMEAATIFTVALGRGVRAGCICLAVDAVGRAGTWADDDVIAAGELELLTVALEAAAALG